MENKNNSVLIVAGLTVVGVAVASVLSFNAGKQESMGRMHMDMMKTSNMASMKGMDHSTMSMDQMTEGLRGKTGDAFDKVFIEMMIVHHQRAVDMAELIPANGKHEELKKLGKDIITAQTEEIVMMKKWLKDWGYEGNTTKTQKEMMDEMMPGMKH